MHPTPPPGARPFRPSATLRNPATQPRVGVKRETVTEGEPLKKTDDDYTDNTPREDSHPEHASQDDSSSSEFSDGKNYRLNARTEKPLPKDAFLHVEDFEIDNSHKANVKDNTDYTQHGLNNLFDGWNSKEAYTLSNPENLARPSGRHRVIDSILQTPFENPNRVTNDFENESKQIDALLGGLGESDKLLARASRRKPSNAPALTKTRAQTFTKESSRNNNDFGNLSKYPQIDDVFKKPAKTGTQPSSQDVKDVFGDSENPFSVTRQRLADELNALNAEFDHLPNLDSADLDALNAEFDQVGNLGELNAKFAQLTTKDEDKKADTQIAPARAPISRQKTTIKPVAPQTQVKSSGILNVDALSQGRYGKAVLGTELKALAEFPIGNKAVFDISAKNLIQKIRNASEAVYDKKVMCEAVKEVAIILILTGKLDYAKELLQKFGLMHLIQDKEAYYHGAILGGNEIVGDREKAKSLFTNPTTTAHAGRPMAQLFSAFLKGDSVQVEKLVAKMQKDDGSSTNPFSSDAAKSFGKLNLTHYIQANNLYKNYLLNNQPK